MKLLKQGMFLMLLKLTFALGSIWILSLLTRSKPGWNPSSVLGNSWLEYTDSDDSPEKVCNCSAILQGEREALEQAKLLTINKDFHKSVHIPDEHYMKATKDCSAFKLRRKYLTSPLSQEEEDFPLAYSMVVHHKDTGKANEPPPINITIMSGSAYFVVSRGFIRSVLEDRRVPALKEWLKHTFIPDELFWATIQRMPGVHGSTWHHKKYDMSDVNAIARLVKWQMYEGSQDSPNARYPECHGSHVRGVCIYGAGDLQWMLKQHHLFANKFDIDTDPVPVYCLEKYLRKRALSGL